MHGQCAGYNGVRSHHQDCDGTNTSICRKMRQASHDRCAHAMKLAFGKTIVDQSNENYQREFRKIGRELTIEEVKAIMEAYRNQFVGGESLEQQLAMAKGKLREYVEKEASSVKVKAAERQQLHDEHNLVSHFLRFVQSRTGTVREFSRVDAALEWNHKIYLGEAKYIKKGGQSEDEAIKNALKIQHYAWVNHNSSPRMFTLFNQKVSLNNCRFYASLDISIVCRDADTYVLQVGDSNLSNLFSVN